MLLGETSSPFILNDLEKKMFVKDNIRKHFNDLQRGDYRKGELMCVRMYCHIIVSLVCINRQSQFIWQLYIDTLNIQLLVFRNIIYGWINLIFLLHWSRNDISNLLVCFYWVSLFIGLPEAPQTILSGSWPCCSSYWWMIKGLNPVWPHRLQPDRRKL